MEYRKAMSSIKMAVIVALISAAVTVITAIMAIITNTETTHVSFLSFVDVVVILGLAFGVYKKSRISAALLIIYYIAGQVIGWLSMGNFSTFPLAIVFCYFYIQGFRGTMAYHNMMVPKKVRNEGNETVNTAKYYTCGIVSFVLGILLFVSTVLSFIILGISGAASSALALIGLLVILSIVIGLTGVILGIIGLVQEQRGRIYSLIGLIMNGAFIMVFVVAAVSATG